MRSTVFGTVLFVLGVGTWAVQPAAQNRTPSTKTFISAGEVSALIAKAKRERPPDQANFVQTIIQLAPYTANLEYRVADVNANAAVHEREAELFYVVEGSGTLVTGGKLRDEKRTNAGNLSGSGIDDGTSREIAKGDFVIVPENTPHWFRNIAGTLVLMSMHVPRGEK